MAFDFKKEYKEFYLPKDTPQIVTVPAMQYLCVRGSGDPNQEGGEYKDAMELLYGMAFTLKMSPKAGYAMEGFFEYVVPPLEGFWWQEGVDGMDYGRKDAFQWLSVIRLPDFVKPRDFQWAKEQAALKKKRSFDKVKLLTLEEGLCVQIMHHGSFDSEPATVAFMDAYLAEQGYENDFSARRLHHEIYLSDARKVAPDKLKTVIRHPIRKKHEQI